MRKCIYADLSGCDNSRRLCRGIQCDKNMDGDGCMWKCIDVLTDDQRSGYHSTGDCSTARTDRSEVRCVGKICGCDCDRCMRKCIYADLSGCDNSRRLCRGIQCDKNMDGDGCMW